MFRRLSKLFGRSCSAMQSIRLVVSDIDGTLLNKDGDLYDSTAKLIHELSTKGMRFILATGRTHYTASDVYELLNLRESCIAFDGALNADADLRIEYAASLSDQEKAALQRSCADLRLSITSIAPGVYDVLGTAYTPVHLQHDKIEHRKCTELGEVFLSGALRYYCLSDRVTIDSLKKRLTMSDDCHDLAIHAWESRSAAGATVLEVRKAHADKGTALARYLQSAGIQGPEVAVIGDYRNDLPMFQPEYFCVALSNAVAELRAKADFVTTADSHKGGVDEFLRTLRNAQD